MMETRQAIRKEHGYEIDEDASTEREVRAFLTALVKVVKPKLVVETGCYVGRATLALADGLNWNGFGSLVSCDIDPEMVDKASMRLRHAKYNHPYFVVRLARGEDLPELREADLVFLDSDYAGRYAEFTLCKRGAVVVVHDSLKSYDSSVEPHAGWVETERGVTLRTYRGLSIVIKR